MNPINYAIGLVTELDYAQRTSDKQREATVREQLAWASGELDKVDADRLSDGVRALLEQAKAEAADALASKPRRTKTASAEA